MQANSFFTHKRLTLPAHSAVPQNISGQLFLCTESTDFFLMSIDDGEKFQMELGLGFRLKPEDFFKQLTFYNETDSDITIQFYAGQGEITDNRLNTLVERQIAVGYRALATRVVATAVAAGVTTTIAGVNAGTQRKQISVYNPGFDNDIEILDDADNLFAVVYPRTSWTHETNATLKVHNLETVTVTVGELYYTT